MFGVFTADTAGDWREDASSALVPVTKSLPGNAQKLSRLRPVLSGGSPGFWARSHTEECNHFTGWTYVAVHAMAKQLSQAKWQVVEEDDAGEARPLPKKHRHCQLLRRPNPEQSGADLRYSIALQLQITGSALLWIVKNGLGIPQEIYVLPTALAVPQPPSTEFPAGSYRIAPLASWNMEIQGDDYTPGGALGQLLVSGAMVDRRQVKAVRWPHPIYLSDGYGPVAAGALAVDVSEQQQRAWWYALKNSSQIGHVFEIDTTYASSDPAMQMAFMEELAARQSGTPNWRKDMLLPPGVTAQENDRSPLEMDFVQSAPQVRDAVLALHHTPSVACGVTEAGSYAQLYAAMLQYIDLAVEPLCGLVGEKISDATLCRPWRTHEVHLHPKRFDDPGVRDMERKTDLAAMAQTVDEYRAGRKWPLLGGKEGKRIAGTPPTPEAPPVPPGAAPGSPTPPENKPDRTLDRTGIPDPVRAAMPKQASAAGKNLDAIPADEAGEQATLIAEVLYHVFGSKALKQLRAAASVKAWSSADHPRGKGGRFIPRGSAEAVSSAKTAVDKALKGQGGNAEELANHLAILTVKQLRDLHQQNGVGRIPKEILREHLVQAVKDKLAPVSPGPESQEEHPETTAPRDREMWSQEAREAGLEPAALHGRVKELKQQDREAVQEYNAVLKEARKALAAFGSAHKNMRSERFQDSSEVPGLDEVAEDLARHRPDLFANSANASDTLFEMMKEGNRQQLTRGELYTRSFQELRNEKEIDDAEREAYRSGHSAASVAAALRAGEEAGEAEIRAEEERAEAGDTSFDFGSFLNEEDEPAPDSQGGHDAGAFSAEPAELTEKPGGAVSRAEAEKRTQHSALKQSFYHATTPQAARAIVQDGFSTSGTKYGKVFGAGVYLASDDATTQRYQNQLGAAAEVVEVKVDVRNPFVAPMEDLTDGFAEMARRLPGGEARFRQLRLEAEKAGIKLDDSRGHAIAAMLRAAGYDALEIKAGPNAHHNVGGSQLVVFDPARVLVIAGEVDSPEHPSARIVAALERYARRSQTAAGGGLFGGEDLQARAGFSKLPDGAPFVFTSGSLEGQTGKIMRDKSGVIMAEVHGRAGLVAIDPSAIEPLNSAQSWRTSATTAPVAQGSLLNADHFLSPRKNRSWEEDKHPRGQPENAGEFGSSGATGVGTESKPSQADQKSLSFNNVQEADAWGVPAFHAWTASLSKDEKWAMLGYTGGGYEDTNEILRMGMPAEKWPGKMPLLVKSLDAALGRAAAPENLTVFRGVRGDFADRLLELAKQDNGHFTDQAYLSTTINQKQVAEFARRRDATNAILEIFVPQGAPGAYTEESAENGECEFLMPRNTTVRVHAAAQDASGVWHVKASIGPDPAPRQKTWDGAKHPRADDDKFGHTGSTATAQGDSPEGISAADVDETSLLIAEILYYLHGAESVHQIGKGSVVKAWDALVHPRGKGGRFIPRGSAEAVSTACAAVDQVLKGQGGDPEKLLEHLALLTVKQLRELHRANGVGPIPSQIVREQLVQAVKDKLVVRKPEAAAVTQPAESPKKEPAQPATEQVPVAQDEKADNSKGTLSTAVDKVPSENYPSPVRTETHVQETKMPATDAATEKPAKEIELPRQPKEPVVIAQPSRIFATGAVHDITYPGIGEEPGSVASRIDYTPSTGPVAGVSLVNGQPGTHPTAGQVVKFERRDNEAAFKKAKVKENTISVRLEGKPDLQEIAAEYDRRQNERNDAWKAHYARQRQRDQERDQPLLDAMHARAAALRAQVPAGNIPVTVTQTGDLDGDPILEYAATDGTKLSWNTPGLVQHGTATAIRPGAWGAFATERVCSIHREDLARVHVANAEKQRQAEEKAAAAQAKRESAFAQAKTTGKPVLLAQWTEAVEEEDNSLNVVTEYALPNGTTRRETHGTY